MNEVPTLPYHQQRISAKALAILLRRSDKYVQRMRRRGFRFVAGRTTLQAAEEWLVRNPFPSRRDG